MKPWQRRTFHALSAIVTVTGIAYFWMKYQLVSDDPFAVVNHPLQSLVLDLHLLSAPAMLVIFGIVFNAHVASKVMRRLPLRRSGLASLGMFALMAVTGYLLPVLVSESLRVVTLWLHIGSGIAFAVSYLVHVVGGLLLWRSVPAVQRSPSA